MSNVNLIENWLKAIITEAVKTEVEKINLHILPEPKPETEYITRQETTQILGISLPTLNEWSKRGILTAYRIASRVRYKKAEVIASLERVKSVKYKKTGQ